MKISDLIPKWPGRQKQLDVTTSSALAPVSLNDLFVIHGTTHESEIFDLLQACGMDYDQLSWHEQVRISRMMFRIFPFVKRAINDMASMTGNVEIIAKEDGAIAEPLLAQMNELAYNMPILSEFDWIRPASKGIDNVAFRVARNLLVDGMIFAETRFEEENLRNHLGVLFFDTLHFGYVRQASGRYELRYLNMQEPQVNPYFICGGFDFHASRPWASGLVSGGEFFTEIIIAMLMSVKNTALRQGAPIETAIVSVKNDERLSHPAVKDAYMQAMDGLEAALKKAMQKQAIGSPSSIVSKIPMDVTLLGKTFGVDMMQSVDPSLLMLVLVSFANLLEVPVEFLGFMTGSSGFSPERFKTLYKIWGAKIDNLRNIMRDPLTLTLRAYFLAHGVSPAAVDAMSIKFLNPQMIDEKDQGELDKTKSETNVNHTKVAELLSMLDTNAARAYLRQNGVIPEQ